MPCTDCPGSGGVTIPGSVQNGGDEAVRDAVPGAQ